MDRPVPKHVDVSRSIGGHEHRSTRIDSYRAFAVRQIFTPAHCSDSNALAERTHLPPIVRSVARSNELRSDKAKRPHNAAMRAWLPLFGRRHRGIQRPTR